MSTTARAKLGTSGVEAAPAATSGLPVRDAWERFGSRYFRAVVKRGRAKETYVELHVEVGQKNSLRSEDRTSLSSLPQSTSGGDSRRDIGGVNSDSCVAFPAPPERWTRAIQTGHTCLPSVLLCEHREALGRCRVGVVQVPSEYPLRPSRLALTKYSGSGSRASVPENTVMEDLRTIATEVGRHPNPSKEADHCTRAPREVLNGPLPRLYRLRSKSWHGLPQL